MKQKKYYFVLVLIMVLLNIKQILADWPMPGHDPQRTSWASEDTSIGVSRLEWYNPIYEWIPARAHIITSALTNTIYVPTAKGIYALDPLDGTQKWMYNTELPVGDSPTIVGNTMYVCCTDHTIHAVDATTGEKIWQTYMAGAPFYCNPLVVNGKVYAGNRDGYFYCFDASNGSYLWSYEINWPINLSAAYQTYVDYPNGLVFFAAEDNCCYALKSDTGELVWKSAKINAESISAFWPVIVDDRVIFVTCPNYFDIELILYHQKPVEYKGATEILSHVDAEGWLDLSNHVADLVQNPVHKTFFVLDYKTGLEIEVSPIFYFGNMGVRYPPAIGPDPTGPGTLVWAASPWNGDTWYTQGHYVGWKMGTTKVRTIPYATSGWESVDEPEAQSIIGDSRLYYNAGGDGADTGGIINLSGGGAGGWGEFSSIKFPAGYNQYLIDRKYGNATGTCMEGYQNPPVPLNDKLYFTRSNAVICVAP